MINNKEYACPECGHYGIIKIYTHGALHCGTCSNRYNQEEALDLTKSEASE